MLKAIQLKLIKMYVDVPESDEDAPTKWQIRGAWDFAYLS